MAFFKSLLIASVAAVAFAAPQGASEGNTKVSASKQSSDAMCGNGQKLACCNSGEDLIGANCLSVPVRTFHSSSPIHQNNPTKLTLQPHSRHPHPASLRLQRRRLLPDRRRLRQPHQPRAQLPRHPPLSASPSNSSTPSVSSNSHLEASPGESIRLFFGNWKIFSGLCPFVLTSASGMSGLINDGKRVEI